MLTFTNFTCGFTWWMGHIYDDTAIVGHLVHMSMVFVNKITDTC